MTIKLSAADINGFLAASPEAELRYDDGAFTVAKSFGALLRIRARAHLDLRGGHVRLAIPFTELGTEHTGHLLGSVTALLWPKWLEPWIEKKVGDLLATRGLPWDLIWLDTIDDPELGRIGTVNFSPRTLNEWLRKQPLPGDLVPRLVALRVEHEALAVGIDLVSRAETAPIWKGGGETAGSAAGGPASGPGGARGF